ncbi:imelysin family protein [Deinococcus sp. YIM 77859]|uniref:imelysin family protein n=1 Tax=Deinococcus sp. YIM 77859 TaxID=1540221 RepID=UPI00054FC46A|nr:imelysin family protein [Deinococcus sp. YIM 77859]
MRLALILLTSALLGQSQAAPLDGVKTYLESKLRVQEAGTAQLVQGADRYYALAKAANFDYRRVAHLPQTRAALQTARAGWIKASPAYEDIEGIVAGVDALSDFDLILDAGTSAAEGGENVVPFDLKLPNGKVLPRPGNLFGVNEAALWGTVKAFGTGVAYDVDGNGTLDFGDQLPDANVLKAAAAELHRQTGALRQAAARWTPTRADVFGALVANVPTVGPVFFENWKTSRFVLGGQSRRTDFVVISRLADLAGNVRSWQVMYAGLSPAVKGRSPALDAQIGAGLRDLAAFVSRLVVQERQRRFTPEQAETLQAEAQDRATAITGRLTQAAALLGIKVE